MKHRWSKRIFAMLLAIILSASCLSGVVGAVGNPFVDVESGTFYYDAVLWAVENGITKGMSDTTFAPQQTCTRAQIVTFLWRAMGEPAPAAEDNPFTDVDPAGFYYKALLWAVENDITKGVSSTAFAPNQVVTRGQVVTFLWRAAGKPAAGSAVNPFTDISESQFYYEAVLWAVENGITKGMSDTTFVPGVGCNRAQIVTFLYRYATQAVKSDLRITSHPTDATVIPNQTLSSLSVTVAGGTAPYRYKVEREYDDEWRVIGEQGNVSETSWTYNGIASSTAGVYRYRVVVVDASGAAATSNPAVITVKSDLRITSHPTDATVVPNQTLSSLSVTVAGGTAPYRYKVEKEYDDEWRVIGEQGNVSETSWTYSGVASSTPGVYRYRIVVIDASGTTATSDSAVITITAG